MNIMRANMAVSQIRIGHNAIYDVTNGPVTQKDPKITKSIGFEGSREKGSAAIYIPYIFFKGPYNRARV